MLNGSSNGIQRGALGCDLGSVLVLVWTGHAPPLDQMLIMRQLRRPPKTNKVFSCSCCGLQIKGKGINALGAAQVMCRTQRLLGSLVDFDRVEIADLHADTAADTN